MMIRRSIVEKHGIRFPEGVACEDLYFHYAVFPWCRRVCVVSRAAYVYRKRAGSITSIFKNAVLYSSRIPASFHSFSTSSATVR